MKAIRQLKKMPKHVFRGMAKVSTNSPQIVNRIPASLAMSSGECHSNVKNWIGQHGGSAVHGWMLTQVQSLAKVGMWAWQFHTVWKDDSGKLVDITNQGSLHDSEKTTFIHDGKRKPDLINGTAYNNIVIFSEAQFACYYGSSINQDVRVGEPYWATTDMRYLEPLQAHSGIYRMLTEKYAENVASLREKYGVEIVANELKGNQMLPLKAFLDFSLSLNHAYP